MLKNKQVRLATLLPILGIVLAACSAAATPAPINTSAPSNTLAPTNTVAPAETSAPDNASSNSLVGKWEGTDVELGALTIEFKSDGVYEITDSSGTYLATYEMVDDDTFILIDPSGLSATVDFVRSGDTLTMTMDGSTLELHRVP
jgi:cytoskeletal protein RodZ